MPAIPAFACHVASGEARRGLRGGAQRSSPKQLVIADEAEVDAQVAARPESSPEVPADFLVRPRDLT